MVCLKVHKNCHVCNEERVFIRPRGIADFPSFLEKNNITTISIDSYPVLVGQANIFAGEAHIFAGKKNPMCGVKHAFLLVRLTSLLVKSHFSVGSNNFSLLKNPLRSPSAAQ